MHVCNRCGKENQSHYKFCLGCGAEMGDAAVAPATVQPSVVPAFAPAVGMDRGVDDGWKSPPSGVRAMDQRGRPAAQLAQADPMDTTQMTPAASPLSDTDPGRTEMPQKQAAQALGRIVPVQASADSVSRPCPTCGNMIPAGFIFCGQCGTRVSENAAKPAPAPAAAPQVGLRGKLVLVRPDGTEGGAHPMVAGPNLIGRGQGLLFDADSYLSPHHADLILSSAGLTVRDADSLNGVFVKITDEEEIADTEVFRIGQELLRFDVIRTPVTMEDGTEVMGSPNPGYWGRVALIIGREQDGSAFPLIGDHMILGRERGDILFPEDGYVSGTHARIACRGGRFFLGDLNSSNGTFLRIRGERVVRSGTFLLMGQQLFRVQFS